jgi:anaerobic selenocysteine-containing dehydrogenase
MGVQGPKTLEGGIVMPDAPGLKTATLAPNENIDWMRMIADYGRIRDMIEATWPETFKDFNKRMWQPGGMPRPLPALKRRWETETGKANFSTPEGPLNSHGLDLTDGMFRLMTIRSNDQFNTTVYGYYDRFRGVSGTRMVVFMNAADIARLGLAAGQRVTLASAAEDGRTREVGGLRVVCYGIPEGCVAAYYPECNPLIPLWHYAEEGKVPAAKSVPVVIRGEASR